MRYTPLFALYVGGETVSWRAFCKIALLVDAAMSDQAATQPVSHALLIRELGKIPQWDILGFYLGLDDSEIEVIERDYRDTARKRLEMFGKWINKDVDVSWEKVIEALERMSQNKLANRLRERYTSLSPLLTCTDPCLDASNIELTVDKEAKVVHEIEALGERYLQLVMEAESAVEEANPPLKKLKRFSQYHKKPEVKTVEELFDQMKPFYFLEYAMLEKIIKFFLSQGTVVDDLHDYLQQLAIFKSSTTVREFMESIEQAQQSRNTVPKKHQLCTVTILLVGEWLEKTMDDLEKLVKELFKDKRYVLTHLKIVRGSIIVTYLAPLSEADSLVMCAKKTTEYFMLEVGLWGLRVGRNWVLQSMSLNFSFEESLFRAVAENRLDLLSFLLSINTNPDAAGFGEQTGLMIASFYNLDKAASLLLKTNADPNLQRDDGMTPLNIASQKGHSEITKTLLKANADPDIQRDDGVTPLYIASQEGHTDIVTLLLAANASLDLHTDNGETPLFIASERGHTNVVAQLLKANANPNFQTEDDVTPLYIASQNGHAEIVTLLLKTTANPNLQRIGGETPLYIAIQKKYFGIITLLLKANANPNIQVEDAYGTTPLISAIVFSQLQVVQLLLASGADPNLQHSSGLTALVFACHSGYLDIVELQLQLDV